MYYGWRIVGVCFAAAVFTWGLGVFGGSVYLPEIRGETGWSTEVITSALTVFFLVNAICLPAIGRAIDRYGPRPVLSLGVLFLAAGVVWVGRLEAVWHLYAAFLFMGFGYATMSVTGLSATVAPWFERHQGRSIALAMTGASFGAMLVVPVLVFAISDWGFDQATLIAAIVLVAVMLPLTLTVLRVRRPADLGLDRDGDPAGTHARVRTGAATTAGRSSATRSLALWTVAIGFALGLIVQVGFLTHHYALAQPMIGAAAAGLLISATGAAGLIGRLVLARVIDRVDPRRYTMGVFAVQTLVLTAFALWPSIPVLVPVSLIYGFCLGQITTLSPIVIRREFGAEAFGAVYGVAGTSIQFGSAFGPLLYGVLVEHFGSYAPVLAVAAGFKVAALLTLWLGCRQTRVER